VRAVLSAALLALALLGCSRESGVVDPSTGKKIAAADKDLDHTDLIGTTPPEWTAVDWINAEPNATSLAQLRGKVVLVRWFMGTSCPFCSATAPSLKKLHADYASRGLVVVDLYHHKEEGPLRPGMYEGYVKSFGFEFPVARDPDWKTLKSWWLTKDRDWTSVTFLLDKSGRVRGIHPGGKYVIGDPSYEAMRRGIERLLGESSN
jgi:thiol-disulfide isomerase/thioredoxin